MKKKVTVVIAIIAVFFLVINGVCNNATSHTDNQLKSALSEKYGWKKSDIEIVSHDKVKPNLWFLGLYKLIPAIWRSNEKWVCNYNSREFNVEYTNNQFADDYQLEDIFKWCTEYLQENVDADIVGVEVFSDIIYHSSQNEELYNYSLPWDTHKVFTKKDVAEFLDLQRKKVCIDGLLIVYKVDGIQSYGNNVSGQRCVLRGNEKYEDFCSKKAINLSKNELTKDCKIVLMNNPSFGRTSLHKSGVVVYLTSYSFEITGEGSYYVEK